MFVDVARAIVELAVARWRLTRRFPARLVNPQAAAQSALDPACDPLLDRVAFVIPRVAALVPWRADCLVQAMAAEHWLERSGIASSLHFGVSNTKTAEFEAHAWLTVGERIVTGGDVSGYTPLRR